MNQKKLQRNLYKHFPRLQEDYKFVSMAQTVQKNRFLQKKEGKKLVSRCLKTLENRFSVCKKGLSPQECLGSVLDSSSPDRLLFSFHDAFFLAVLLFLQAHRNSRDSSSALRFSKESLNDLEQFDFEEYYLQHSKVHRILESRNFLSYPSCDRESQNYIRRLVYDYAEEHNIPDAEAARAVTEKDMEKKYRHRKAFCKVLLILLPLLFLLVVALSCGVLPALLLCIPACTLANEIVCTIASFTVRPAPILKLESRPITEKIVSVITVLATSPEDGPHFARRLERMYLQNPDENVAFGLLADYKDAPVPTLPEDEKIATALEEAIHLLNRKYGNHFCLFLRGRSKSPSEKIYMGWERKRGALIELNRFLLGREDRFEKVILPKGFRNNTAYILTLDADTDLRIGALRRLYATLKHPYNRPKVKNGVVVSGYGVLQPRMVTGVDSAGRSPFSALYAGGGGIDSYQNAVFDFYQSVFGRGAFCGKGIFDVRVFDQVVDGQFPEGRILSHDLLEGTRLRCGYLSEMTLTDSVPSTALSFFNRQHRWLRGDFQTLPFALFHLPFRKDRKKNPIIPLSKYMIFSNVIRALTPVFSLLALFFSTLLSESQCAVFLLFSFSYLLFPLVCTLLRTVRYVGRRFYSTVMQNVWQGICQTLYALCSLAYNAQLSLDALIRVVYRELFSQKKLLQWVTAGEGEKKYAKKKGSALLLLYLYKALPSLAVAGLMLFYAEGGAVRLLSASFLAFPFVSFFLSRPYKHQNTVTEKEKEQLLCYAKESFSYFEEFVTEKEHFLPPDNYQELPVSAVAHRTSPTNIALYLLSVQAMQDLGLADEKTTLDRLEKTLSTIEALPKYRGHLYNWYDTRTLDLLGHPYISTVDSGNLVLSLIALKNALAGSSDPKAEELCKRVFVLIDRTDFSFLYNPKRRLLSIGYDPLENKQSENCYDLLLSEARSAYYFAIAKRQIPPECWSMPGRPITVRDGHLGVLSWSGTAFEYFMPALFLPVYRNTLLYEALCFALYEQSNDRTEQLWGRSESGYFAFDNEMNYQYKAFGCSSLSLDPTVKNEDVLSPYSSFLTLTLSVKPALENIRRLEKAGAKGNYGFYEAMDFTASRVGKGNAVIRSYMAHHLGMSIVAATNACKDHIFVKRVLSEPLMDAATELLKEGVPADAPVSKGIRRKSAVKGGLPALFSSLGEGTASDRRFPAYTLLYRGPSRILAGKSGHIELFFKDIALTPPAFPSAFPKVRPDIFFETENETGGFLNGSCRFFSDGGQLGFSKEGKTKGEAHILAGEQGFFLFHTALKTEKKSRLLFFFPLAFGTKAELQAHPSFNGLAVECAYLEKERLLLFEKRMFDEKRPALFLAFAFADSAPFSYLSRADDLPAEEGTTLAKALFSADFKQTQGPCRRPVAVLKCSFEGEKETDLILAFGKDREKVLGQIKLLREKAKGQSLYKILQKEGKQLQKNRPDRIFPDRTTVDFSSLLLLGCLSFRNPKIPLPRRKIGELWQYALSGDYPIFTFSLPDGPLTASQKKLLSGLVKAHSYLAFGGVYCDLVFLRKENDLYFSPGRKEFEELVKDVAGSARLYKKGGIHLLSDLRAKEILPSFSRVYLHLDGDCVYEVFKKQFEDCLQPKRQTTLKPCLKEPFKVPADGQKYGECFFLPEGVLLPNRRGLPPHSYIYANRQFGTLLTQNSLGFTWFRNSGEFRLTPFQQGEDEWFYGEKLILHTASGALDLCACASSVFYKKGCALYEGRTDTLYFRLNVGVDPKLPVKLLSLSLKNEGPLPLDLSVEYQIQPCLGTRPDGNVTLQKENDMIFCRPTAQRDLPPFGLYFSDRQNLFGLKSCEEKKLVFLLGVYNLQNDRCFYYVKERFSRETAVEEAFDRAEQTYSELLSAFRLLDVPPSLGLAFNYYIPYQSLSARLWGRTGFYQPGGAYGFRDQLQDALCLIPLEPRFAEQQIYRSAKHQYWEGDVQHWWHRTTISESRGDWGVRSLCSDDLLFLPYVTACYVLATGDREILEKKISYLSSLPLSEERERCERPAVTARKESVYFHCLRALEHAAARRSPRGLLYMGSCDWNDGFSQVEGESVWLTQFFLLTVNKFLEIARPEEKEFLSELKKDSEKALDTCFENGRFLRAFFQDGTPLGRKGNDYCAIDLLPQAFSAFLSDGRARTALNTAYSLLYDPTYRIFRLFAPSYDRSLPFPGYLGGYCPGFRENGGQYTHAAVWGAMAFLRAGEHRKGFEVFRGLNPFDRAELPFYKTEPYALAGDVYAAPGFEGRGGWSLYTGSAGWFFKGILEELLGYRETKEYFTLSPKLCEDFERFTLEVRKKNSFYRIEVCPGKENLLLLDGKPTQNRFFFDKGTHSIKMVLQKEEKCSII